MIRKSKSEKKEMWMNGHETVFLETKNGLRLHSCGLDSEEWIYVGST
jgi:hypothetical protein